MSIYRIISGCLLMVVFSCLLRADIVWDPDKGWRIKGGVLESYFGEFADVDNALEAMNRAKRLQEEGQEGEALTLYEGMVKRCPDSIFAPEALYQIGEIRMSRHQWESAYTAFSQIIKNYPDYPHFDEVIKKQYEIASLIQRGKRPYLWGKVPWFHDYKQGMDIYEGVVESAPFSDFAPASLFNIAELAKKTGKTEEAIDALDRLINDHPDSVQAPDAYFSMARIYASLIQGPEYDQSVTREAINFYQDFLLLFPREERVAEVEEGLREVLETLAQSKYQLGYFYYRYRNNPQAALIFFNEAITTAPRSRTADEARQRISDIRKGIKAKKTLADWILGRYKRPGLQAYKDSSRIEKLQADVFEEEMDEVLLLPPES